MRNVLSVRGLRVTGRSGDIVRGIDLDVDSRETVAIVGESGSGKSMTAKAVTGLLPTGVTASGRLRVGTDDIDLSRGPEATAGLRGRRVSLLLQNPFTSLSPLHRCGAQIMAARRGRADRGELLRRLDEVGLPERVAMQFPFELSGGMRQRVALAASLAGDPEILIGDEPTTALDVTNQRQVLDLVAQIQRSRGMAFVLITHDLAVARERADKVVVLYAGTQVESGSHELLRRPRHPYTAGLRDSEPPLAVRLTALPVMPGAVPQAGEVLHGCVFAERCGRADDRCRSEAPELRADRPGDDGRAACWHPLEQATEVSTPRAASTAPTASTSDLLTVSDARRRFGTDRPPALDGVSLRVGAGEAVALVGESGSGKTTLARAIVGLERLDSGEVHWAAELPVARCAQVVFQDPGSSLNPALSVGAALREALRAAGRSPDEVRELLAMVGLPHSYSARRPAALSGGEQQRVAIARAVATRPQLLVCDEPVSSLDVSVQAQILNLLNDLRRDLGIAILLITHDLAVARQVVDRVYVMHQGAVVESGVMDTVLSDPRHEYTRHLLASVVQP